MALVEPEHGRQAESDIEQAVLDGDNEAQPTMSRVRLSKTHSETCRKGKKGTGVCAYFLLHQPLVSCGRITNL